MAITRTQIAKQLLALGGRIGFQGGGADLGAGASGMGSGNTGGNNGGEDRGRDPMAQFSSGPPSAKGRQGVEDMRDELRSTISAQNRANLFENLINNPVFKAGLYFANPAIGKLTARNVLTGIDAAKTAKNIANNPLGVPDFFSEEEEEEKDKDMLETLAGGITNMDKVMSRQQQIEAQAKELGFNIGGRVGLMEGGMPYEGGIMDLESARQMYGFGKLVKKVTRTVKKIAKSPVGKAALIYAGGAGLGALGTGTSFMSNLTSPTALFRNLSMSGKGFLTGISKGGIQFPGASVASNAPKAFKLGEFFSGTGGVGAAISLASALPLLGIGTGEESEEEAKKILDDSGFSLEDARNSILARARDDYKMDFRARGFRAEGGLMRLGYKEGDLTKDANYKGWVKLYEKNPDVAAMNEKHKEYLNFYERDKTKQAEGSKEPVAKKTMPLLDMDGKEMDLREEGGFVPIGRMEKADDVPARLSKNEFVFTADAVRNAGEGDVDKGAEVMYNMMKNLESGGDVSEESQGLEGARKMFQTSQRLEEVL